MPHESERFQLADRLHSAAIHLLRRVRKQDTVMAEVPARLSALSVLVFGGACTLGQLAAAEQVKPPTMTRIVRGLEKSGLAEGKSTLPMRGESIFGLPPREDACCCADARRGSNISRRTFVSLAQRNYRY